jgi:hypothetical protein
MRFTIVFDASRDTFRANRGLWERSTHRSLLRGGWPGGRLALDPLVHDHCRRGLYPFVLVASIWGGTLAGLSSLAISADRGLSLAAADGEFQPYGGRSR